MSDDTQQPPAGFAPIQDPLGSPGASAAPPPGYAPIRNPVGDPNPAPVKMAADVNPFEIGAKTVGNDLLGAVETVGTGIVNTPHAALSAIDNALQHAAGVEHPQRTSFMEVTPTLRAREFMSAVGSSPLVQNPVSQAVIGKVSQEAKAHPAISDAVQDVAGILPAAGAVREVDSVADAAAAAREAEAESAAQAAARPLPTAEENLAAQTAASTGNMGAAVAPPSLAGTSPGLKQAVASAKNINHEALTRQIDADTLPMPDGETPTPLRKGQATRDDQQISDEINMRSDPDTQGLLANSIEGQNKTLGLSMGEIRRRATPGIVGRTSAEHGQAAIDAIRAQDNAALSDIRAKYGALADAAGGVMPLDTGAAANGIDAELAAKLKTKVAASDPTISEVMESLRSGEPMTFDTYNNAVSNLAEVQRARTPASVAAGIVRGRLESMPMSPEWDRLKALRDQASSAAKARFNTIDRNPAYAAVVDDNVARTPNGLHVIGAPSPLADKFMDTYFLGNVPNAARAYVQRIKGVMAANPDFSQAVEASALNKLRDSAGLDQFDTGNFAHANFRKTWKSLAPKSDVLMSPETIDNVEHLGRYSDDVNYAGKSSSINRSNTALTLQRFGAKAPPSVKQPTVPGELAGHAIDVAAAHAGPLAYGAKRVGSILWKGAQEAKAAAAKQAAEESVRAAKLKFAQDATAPGAGIDMGVPPPAPAAGSRATGGRVDHEILVSGLMDRWHAARKASKKATEPLLNLPDETISKALDIAATPRLDVVRQLAGGA